MICFIHRFNYLARLKLFINVSIETKLNFVGYKLFITIDFITFAIAFMKTTLPEMNSTESQLKQGPDGWSNLFLYGCYIFKGLFVGVGNVIIICAILKYKAFRTSKVYVIIMGLSVADAVHAVALVWAGVYRIIKVITGTHSIMMRAWDCMWTLHSLIWSFSHSQSSLMLVAVSLDRLVSVAIPLSYITWPTSYAWIMIGGIYVFTWTMGAFGIALTYHTHDGPPDQVWGSCIPPQAFKYSNKVYATYFAFAPVTYSIISILLYIAVWFMYKRKQGQVSDKNNKRKDDQRLKQERRITKNLGICCLCTFFFYLVPWLGGNVSTWLGYQSLNFIFWVLNINAACNLFIYPLKMAEIKKAVHGLFTGKILPDNIELWNNKPRSIIRRE